MTRRFGTATVPAIGLYARDCVCAVDLPDGTHLLLDGAPEVLATATVPERDTTVVAFLDRDAVAWPAGSSVTVYRRGGEAA
jgi:hypothetical protein